MAKQINPGACFRKGWVLTEVFHRRLHLGHTNNVGNSSLGSNDASKCVGVLLSELFKEHDTELAEELVFSALFDDDGKTTGQIGGLLPDLGALVVQPPENG